MVEVKIRDGCIAITGHANFARRGKDIVCAAVSTLVQTFVASVEQLTDDEITYTMEPGKVIINYGNLSKTAQSLKDSLFIGLKMVANTCPEHVVIK